MQHHLATLDAQSAACGCRRKQAEVDRLAAAEQEADKQLMDAAMRKDAQDQAADKQLKAERKAEQLNYRSPSMLCFPSQNIHRENSLAESVVVLVNHDVYMQATPTMPSC